MSTVIAVRFLVCPYLYWSARACHLGGVSPHRDSHRYELAPSSIRDSYDTHCVQATAISAICGRVRHQRAFNERVEHARLATSVVTIVMLLMKRSHSPANTLSSYLSSLLSLSQPLTLKPLLLPASLSPPQDPGWLLLLIFCGWFMFAYVRMCEQCPAWCGLPPEETSFLRGVFISTPGASQEDLIHGHGGGCLIVWRFEGALFQRYRTGMNYTSLSLLPFTENPADSVFDRMLKNVRFSLPPRRLNGLVHFPYPRVLTRLLSGPRPALRLRRTEFDDRQI